jgi:hypothetical protein
MWDCCSVDSIGIGLDYTTFRVQGDNPPLEGQRGMVMLGKSMQGWCWEDLSQILWRGCAGRMGWMVLQGRWYSALVWHTGLMW